MQDLSNAIYRLPEIASNPALRNPQALESIIKSLTPIILGWAVHQCEKALVAQASGEEPK